MVIIQFLVGGIPTPLKNMKVNWDDDIPIYGKHNLLNHQSGISYTHNIHGTIDGILVATLAHAARFGQTHVDFSPNKKHKQAAGGCTKVIYILYTVYKIYKP